jgi:hypothetical protein
MGYRLAAAGPRTRQRLLDRQAEAEDEQADDSFSISPAMLRRIALLGTAGACSFGLVLAAQGRDWGFLHHTEMQSEIIAQADAAPAALPPTPSLLSDPPTLTAEAAPEEPAKLAAAVPPAEPRMPAAQPAPVHIRIPDKAPRALAEIARPHPRPIAPRPEILASRLPETRPAETRLPDAKPHAPHPPVVARYELPRWLTDYHPVQKHVLVMSEPPHDLTPPPGAEHRAPEPAPAPAPAQQPAKLQFASAAPPPRPRPALRAPYGYGYAYGYGGPYAYGPAYYPYAPPPPAYYGRW